MLDSEEFKKFFLYCLIGSFVISALVAVVTVLVGTFNDITSKVFLTLLMAAIHSLVCLGFIWDNDRQDTFERLSFFINVLFTIIVASFLASILGIWKVIPSEVVGNIYQTFFVVGFAALHADILSKALNKENYIDMIVYLNYVFMSIVVVMLLPIIYMSNPDTLGDMFFRVLGAAAIIDGTLSILTIIFYKLYMNKHPKAESPLQNISAGSKHKRSGLSIWVWILIIYLAAQIVLPSLFFGLGRFW